MIVLYLIANSADTDEMQHSNLGLYLMYLFMYFQTRISHQPTAIESVS